jgi:hypothetical protein
MSENSATNSLLVDPKLIFGIGQINFDLFGEVEER